MWVDNSQISLADLRDQKNLKLMLKDLRFIVPLRKKDLYLIRSVSETDIISDQFIFIDEKLVQDLPKEKFSFWFWDVAKEYLKRTTLTWIIGGLGLASFYGYLQGWTVYPYVVPWMVKTSLFCTTVIPLSAYYAFSAKTKYYSLRKIFKTELWVCFITTSIFVYGLFRIMIGKYDLF